MPGVLTSILQAETLILMVISFWMLRARGPLRYQAALNWLWATAWAGIIVHAVLLMAVQVSLGDGGAYQPTGFALHPEIW